MSRNMQPHQFRPLRIIYVAKHGKRYLRHSPLLSNHSWLCLLLLEILIDAGSGFIVVFDECWISSSFVSDCHVKVGLFLPWKHEQHVSVGTGLDIEAFPCCEVGCLGLDDRVECSDVHVELAFHAVEVLEKLQWLAVGGVGYEELFGLDGLDYKEEKEMKVFHINADNSLL